MTTSKTIATDVVADDLAFRRYRMTSGAEVHSFRARLIHIGSGPDNDLVLDDPTVSRVHARLEFDRSGYLLKDLASKNGTWIGEVRVAEAYVPHGAPLRFGHAQVTFELEEETIEVRIARGDTFGRLDGQSSQMREIFGLLAKVAPSDATVLVEGESGTGKELVAEALHQHSDRRDQPLVVFDCSAVAPDLIESELFGHVRGAFTGAVANRQGVFEQADGGTLFLDEVGEMPLDLQPKLLRALESGQVKPVGGSSVRETDVRVIAATNRQLHREVEASAFRQDLYYRLAVIHVRLPALRQRPEDIPLLVERFLEAMGAADVAVGFGTMMRLQSHPWPGNVRELKNYVSRAVVLAEDGRLETRHLTGVDPPALNASGETTTALEVDYDLPFKDAKARL
ncbi:MAG: sigma 54-interacting transcriptional regulator, partial [Myxococcota bacterium]|nr:sigma 54-interacting transcriptional regulator [Myxococcota bacterium]